MFPKGGELIIRGGGWYYAEETHFREFFQQGYTMYDIGFRCHRRAKG